MRALAVAFVLAASCGNNGGGAGSRPDARPLRGSGPCVPVGGTPGLTVEEVATGLSQPLAIAQPPGEDRLFVAEKGGRIRIIENGTPRATPFLDIRSQISTGSEQGLLGMAFHPGYGDNGRF